MGSPPFLKTERGASRPYFMEKISLLVVTFSLVAFWAQAQAMPSEHIRELDRENRRQFYAIPFRAVIKGYRNFMGKGRKSFCPMTPSCSTYGQEALNKSGPFWGALMTADRLHRCGHDLRFFLRVMTSEGAKFLDLPQRGPTVKETGEAK